MLLLCLGFYSLPESYKRGPDAASAFAAPMNFQWAPSALNCERRGPPRVQLTGTCISAALTGLPNSMQPPTAPKSSQGTHHGCPVEATPIWQTRREWRKVESSGNSAYLKATTFQGL